MALIHPNEWQIMLKSERLTRDLQMACFQHADSSKNQSIKIIICLFSAFYARISKSIQSFAHEMTTVLPRMAETEQTFPVGVQGHAPWACFFVAANYHKDCSNYL